jgi:hypothetical protein
MRLIAISFVACLLCAPALAAAKKQTALASKAEECCGKFGGRWNPLTTPGICYGLGQATSIAYRQCAGR